MRFLVAESEPPEARRKRRESVGKSSGETYLDVLAKLAPGSTRDRVKPADAQAEVLGVDRLRDYDAVVLTGSPLHLYDETEETRREVAFMRAVFAAGVPAFGSCAGLQVAVVAAGGEVRSMQPRREAAFARRISPTAAGATHPLLAGRPAAFDAPAIHTDEVARLPQGATLLASNATTTVQAVEIRCGQGVFWGVQYHPEISLFEVAAALRRDADSLIEAGLVDDEATLGAHAAMIEALHEDPTRSDLAWRLGLDAEVTDPSRRTREIGNFIEHLVRPSL